MPQLIEVPGMGTVEFPDGMSESDIVKAIEANMPASAGSSAYRKGAAANAKEQSVFAGLNGMTFGFGDEIAGAGAAAIRSLPGVGNGKPFAQNYEAFRDYARGANDTYRKTDPVMSTATDMLSGQGMARAAAPLLGFAKGGMIGQTVAGGALGGLSGAVNGVGNSRNMEDAGGDSARSGALGMAMGAMGIPVASGIGSVVNNVVDRFSESSAMRSGMAKVAENLMRDAKTSQPLARAERRLGVLGDEATIADAGGANTRQLLDVLAVAPGRTKQAAEQVIAGRQASSGRRMMGAAEDAMGTGGVRLASTMDEWISQRASQAGPLYERVHKVDVPQTQQLAQFVDIAERNGLTGIAKRIADYDKQPFSLTAGSGQYSMRDLDYIKQAMDQKIAGLRDKETQRLLPEGVALQGLKDDFLKYLDRATAGQYKAARDAFAGPSALIDAAGAGRRALSTDADSIKEVTSGMSRSEKDAFSLGAFEALRAKAGTPGGRTELMNMRQNDILQEKLKAIFGSERAYREFAANVAKEARLKQLNSTGRGSQTAARAQGLGDMEVDAITDVASIAANAKAGNLLSAAGAVRNAFTRVGTPEPVRDAMGQVLLSRGAAARQNLSSLDQIMQEIQANRRNQAAALGVTGGMVPGLLQF